MIEYLQHTFTFNHVWYTVLGSVIGTIIGLIPGLGPAAVVSMMLPFAIGLDPISGIALLSGIYYGSQYGGSTTAILFNIPGESSSIMTVRDGHQMARRGQAGLAIFAAGISSFIGGVSATLLLIFLAPPLSDLAFLLGPAEYTILILLAFIVISVIAARGSIVSGMMMSLLGCLVGMIGVDVSTGVSRFSLGQDFLYDGINFIALSVAMFAVAEIIYNHASHSITRFDNITVKFSNLIQHFRQIIKPAARGSIIGTLLGLLPGGGITISSYTAYAYESRYDKSLGTGSIGGVSSAEAANNASAHSGYIPLLSIGLPENAVMAIMLGAMMIMGVMPGPTLINEQSDVFWGIVVSMLVGNVLLLVLNVPMIKIWTSLLRIPKSVLYPMIFVLSTLAVYSARNNPADILVLAIISVIGYIMVALRLEAVSFIVGFILGPKFETMLTRSLTISGGDVSIFYTSWINILMLSVIIITLTYHIIKNRIINSNNNT